VKSNNKNNNNKKQQKRIRMFFFHIYFNIFPSQHSEIEWGTDFLFVVFFVFGALRCQFHQPFTRTFFVQKFVQSQNVTRKKAFIRKICAFNVDEIDHRSKERTNERRKEEGEAIEIDQQKECTVKKRSTLQERI